jgi:hypothetical protein
VKGIVSIILEKGRFLKNQMGYWTAITAEQAFDFAKNRTCHPLPDEEGEDRYDGTANFEISR